MDFYSVIDTAAFIWDIKNFAKNDKRYYALSSLLLDFLKVMQVERPSILLRDQLKTAMFNEFPWETKGIPNFWELSRVLSAFLSNADIIEFNGENDKSITSSPDIVYEYYKEDVKVEVRYLVREMHTNSTEIKYFTFCPIWNKKRGLETKALQVSKAYDTVVQCSDELKTFLENQKPKFIHSSKHNKLIRNIDIKRGYKLVDGKRIYPLSSNYDADSDRPQKLLELAISNSLEPGKLFYYDDVHNTYVCFMKTEGRIYHGYDIPEEQLLEPIKEAVLKKYHEQQTV